MREKFSFHHGKWLGNCNLAATNKTLLEKNQQGTWLNECLGLGRGNVRDLGGLELQNNEWLGLSFEQGGIFGEMQGNENLPNPL